MTKRWLGIVALVAGAAGFCGVALREDPRLSALALRVGLAYRIGPLVGWTLSAEETLKSTLEEIRAAEQKRITTIGVPGSRREAAQTLQGGVRSLLLMGLEAQAPLVADKLLETYLQGDESGAPPWLPVAVFFELDPSRVEKMADGGVELAGFELQGERAVVTLRVQMSEARVLEVGLLMQRGLVLWRLVGVAGVGELLEELRTSST